MSESNCSAVSVTPAALEALKLRRATAELRQRYRDFVDRFVEDIDADPAAKDIKRIDDGGAWEELDNACTAFIMDGVDPDPSPGEGASPTPDASPTEGAADAPPVPADSKTAEAQEQAGFEEKMAGKPDQEIPHWLEFVCSEHDGAGERSDLVPGCPTFVANRIEATPSPENPDMQCVLSGCAAIGIGGARLIISPGSSKEGVLGAIEQMRAELEKYWGGLCLAPESTWTMVCDYRIKNWKGESDKDTSTWSAPRLAGAMKAIAIASFFPFAKAGAEFQRSRLESLKNAPAHADSIDDALTVLRNLAREMAEPAA